MSPPSRRDGPARADNHPLAFPPFTRARRVRAELAAGILRKGRVIPDETFDEIYPEAVRRASSVHWTPVRVCQRVLELLQLPPRARVLDVGAGVGKFCIVASAMGQLIVRGVERELHLAEVAREAARRLGVEVDIAHAMFEAEDPRRFAGVYLFNPFMETILLPGVAAEIPQDRFIARAAADVAAAERFLDRALVGTRVVTFCGFGGTFPPGYERLASEAWEGGVLELRQRRSRAADE